MMLIHKHFLRFPNCSIYGISFYSFVYCIFPVWTSVKLFQYCDTSSKSVYTLCRWSKLHHKKQLISSVTCLFTTDFEFQYGLVNRH